MTPDEKLLAVSPAVLYLSCTEEFLADIKASVSELGIEILEEDKGDNLTYLRVKTPNTFQFFALGAFVQLEREMRKLKQKMVDDIYKDNNQLS